MYSTIRDVKYKAVAILAVLVFESKCVWLLLLALVRKKFGKI